MKVIIYKSAGGFRITDVGRKRLIELGINQQKLSDDTKIGSNDDETAYLNQPVIRYREDGRYQYYWGSKNESDIEIRSHPLVLKIFKEDPHKYFEDYYEKGSKNGFYNESYKVVEIPDNLDVYIHEREDGSEVIYEEHRSWD